MTLDNEKMTLSVKELADMLGLSVNMTYEHLIQGNLPYAHKLGKKWIISRKRTIEFIDNSDMK